MTIGIDARMMGKGFGIGRYIEQLVLGLVQRNDNHRYILFVRNALDFEIQSASRRTKFKIILCDIPWYSLEEQIKFSRIIKKEKVDLMFFPHWNVPIFYNDPFVVTIHDLTMYHFPRPEATTLGPIKFFLKDKAHRMVVRHAVKKAKHIIAASEWTKQDVIETLGVVKEKISVVYQEPFSDFRFQISDFRFETPGITKPYVLYVGAAYPHKNLERLIAAWKLFQEKHGDTHQLVLVGKHDYFYRRLIQSFNIQYPISNISFFDFVSDSELDALYRNATLFVFPSLSEGFGLPPLEAMARGVPVAASSAACLPEILGEAALYFDPYNEAYMADTIYQALTDEEVRHMLRQQAKENLHRFSFAKSVEETCGVFEGIGNRI